MLQGGWGSGLKMNLCCAYNSGNHNIWYNIEPDSRLKNFGNDDL